MTELPKQEPFPGETLIADGWTYNDFPRMKREEIVELVAVIGSENIRWLTYATYPDGTERWQVFISPQGTENMRTWLKKEEPQS